MPCSLLATSRSTIAMLPIRSGLRAVTSKTAQMPFGSATRSCAGRGRPPWSPDEIVRRPRCRSRYLARSTVRRGGSPSAWGVGSAGTTGPGSPSRSGCLSLRLWLFPATHALYRWTPRPVTVRRARFSGPSTRSAHSASSAFEPSPSDATRTSCSLRIVSLTYAPSSPPRPSWRTKRPRGRHGGAWLDHEVGPPRDGSLVRHPTDAVARTGSDPQSHQPWSESSRPFRM